jgi:hypothetical protein
VSPLASSASSQADCGDRMSLHHHENPFNINVNGEDFGVGYWPGDSRSGMVSSWFSRE